MNQKLALFQKQQMDEKEKFREGEFLQDLDDAKNIAGC